LESFGSSPPSAADADALTPSAAAGGGGVYHEVEERTIAGIDKLQPRNECVMDDERKIGMTCKCEWKMIQIDIDHCRRYTQSHSQPHKTSTEQAHMHLSQNKPHTKRYDIHKKRVPCLLLVPQS
jgi:hypothetical protein